MWSSSDLLWPVVYKACHCCHRSQVGEESFQGLCFVITYCNYCKVTLWAQEEAPPNADVEPCQCQGFSVWVRVHVCMRACVCACECACTCAAMSGFCPLTGRSHILCKALKPSLHFFIEMGDKGTLMLEQKLLYPTCRTVVGRRQMLFMESKISL